VTEPVDADRFAVALAAVSLAELHIDDDVAHEVDRRILDTVGCACAANAEGGQDARRWVDELATNTDVPIWRLGMRADVGTATLVNGGAARLLDLNDTYLGADNLHPSDVLPALMALAEQRGSSRAALVEAAAVSYGVGVALADALPLWRLGWDHVNITGLAACCGVGRLLGLSHHQLVQALSMLAVSHLATRQTRVGEISMWKGFAAPEAIGRSITLCRLARVGVAGPFNAFLGKHGFFHQVGIDVAAADELIEVFADPAALGRGILSTHIKRWRVGYMAQSAIDAAEQLLPRIPGFSSIERVEVITSERARSLMGASPERWAPTTAETADHSIPYTVGEMLRHGELTAQSYTEQRYADPETHAFLGKCVTVSVADEYNGVYPRQCPARVVVTLTDGTELAAEVLVPLGHALAPLPDAALVDKFHRNADPLVGHRAAAEFVSHVLADGDRGRPLDEIWRWLST
jgi:2-methylcitrate dehydratase